jgi:hypothetical protein
MTLQVDYVCVDGSTNVQTCKNWRQTGKIKQEGKACFPGNAIVITKKGPKQMGHVNIGDELLGRDPATGQVSFSKVRAWLHRDVDAVSDMTVVETVAGVVIASPKHSLATRTFSANPLDVSNTDTPEGGVAFYDYTFATELKAGQGLISPGQDLKVIKTHTQSAKGAFSPLTHHSNFFVGASELSVVLAHSFAHLRRPRWYENAVHGAMSLAELVSPKIHDIDYEVDRKYLHPVLRHFAPVAPWLAEIDGPLVSREDKAAASQQASWSSVDSTMGCEADKMFGKDVDQRFEQTLPEQLLQPCKDKCLSLGPECQAFSVMKGRCFFYTSTCQETGKPSWDFYMLQAGLVVNV